MGLVPGAQVRVVTVAPLGDPLRIEVRGGEWSIRRAEAAQIAVEVAREAPAEARRGAKSGP
jgi:Fe2+ transport system protein FeoA